MLTFPEFSLCRPRLVAFCISERRPQENKPEIVILVTQSCLTLCDPMDCSLPGSSVLGIFQARILEWVAIPFSRGSSQPRNQTQVSHTAGRLFTVWATRDQLPVFMMPATTILKHKKEKDTRLSLRCSASHSPDYKPLFVTTKLLAFSVHWSEMKNYKDRVWRN